MEATENVKLTLCELEILLMTIAPREKQQMGAYFDSVKRKLTAARNKLFDGMAVEVVKVEPQAELFGG